MWRSKKIHFMVQSTMTAENLALVEAAEAYHAGYLILKLSYLLSELLSYNQNVKIQLPIACFTEIQQLYDSPHSICPVLDKRLTVGTL